MNGAPNIVGPDAIPVSRPAMRRFGQQPRPKTGSCLPPSPRPRPPTQPGGLAHGSQGFSASDTPGSSPITSSRPRTGRRALDSARFAEGRTGAPPSMSVDIGDGHPGATPPGYSRSSPSANPEAANLPPPSDDSSRPSGDSLATAGISSFATADSTPTKWVYVNSRGFQPTVRPKEIPDPEGVAPSAPNSDRPDDSTRRSVTSPFFPPHPCP
jgi:hypothetical protein